MRVTGSITMSIDDKGEVILSNAYWQAETGPFMEFARKMDQDWCAKSRMRQRNIPYSQAYQEAGKARFRVRKHKGGYRFSFGRPRSGDPTDYSWRTDNTKGDWAYNAIGCSSIVVHRNPFRENKS